MCTIDICKQCQKPGEPGLREFTRCRLNNRSNPTTCPNFNGEMRVSCSSNHRVFCDTCNPRGIKDGSSDDIHTVKQPVSVCTLWLCKYCEHIVETLHSDDCEQNTDCILAEKRHRSSKFCDGETCKLMEEGYDSQEVKEEASSETSYRQPYAASLNYEEEGYNAQEVKEETMSQTSYRHPYAASLNKEERLRYPLDGDPEARHLYDTMRQVAEMYEGDPPQLKQPL